MVELWPKQQASAGKNFEKTERKMQDMYGRRHEQGWDGGRERGMWLNWAERQ